MDNLNQKKCFDDDCVFCNIILKKIPSDIIFENSSIIIIKDINPQASIHYLAIPKKHIKNLSSINPEDYCYITNLFKSIQEFTKDNGIEYYKIVINNGSKAGQVVFHLHIHILSGKDIKLV